MSGMRVAFDGHVLRGQRTGIHVYTRELVGALAAADPRGMFGFYFFSPRYRLRLEELGLAAPNIRVEARRLTHRGIRALWRVAGMPAIDRLIPGYDIYHATGYTPPPARRAKVVVTICDLWFLVCPEHAERSFGRYYGRYLRSRIDAADAIICISEATRAQVDHFFPRARGERHVVHLGGGGDPIAVPPGEAEAARARHGLPRRFVLFVGHREPRKNLVRLVRAFSLARAGPDTALVLAGSCGRSDAEIQAAGAEAGLGARLRLLGHVPEAELGALYAASSVVAYPSLFEGFGLPVIEAFRHGVPVVTSDRGSLPEVAGDAALIANPEDERALADALAAALDDRALRASLIERGFARARRFTWERCALETRRVYERLLEGGRPAPRVDSPR